MIDVLSPGLLTTVQDLGRPHHRAAGVSPGGAVDLTALRLANALVGNPPGTAALEITLTGPTLRFERASAVALAGAPGPATLAGRGLRAYRPYAVSAGQELWVGHVTAGVRRYLAVAGGFDVPTVLGSASTDLKAGFGGLAGRPLRAGDRLFTHRPTTDLTRFHGKMPTVALLEAVTDHPLTVRALPGPEYDGFSAEAREMLWKAPFEVTGASDRTGCRLAAPRLAVPRLAAPRLAVPALLGDFQEEMISTAVTFGTVQVPPGGRPIVLLADHPTTGGYPRPLQVIAADRSKVAQAAPGQSLRFREVTLAEARRCHREREQALRKRETAFRLVLKA